MKDKVKFNVSDEETNNLPNDIQDKVPDEEPITTDPESDDSIESETDAEEAIQNDVEEQFYVGGQYDELRDAMQDTDFRLYLIGNDLVIPGTLEGNEIQFLDIVGDEGEEEFVMKPAPNTLAEVLEFNTLYNTENTEVEVPEGLELKQAPHEKIVEYILNLKLGDEDAEDVEDDEQEISAKEREEDEDDESDEE